MVVTAIRRADLGVTEGALEGTADLEEMEEVEGTRPEVVVTRLQTVVTNINHASKSFDVYYGLNSRERRNLIHRK